MLNPPNHSGETGVPSTATNALRHSVLAGVRRGILRGSG
jgi:hypothetical protein